MPVSVPCICNTVADFQFANSAILSDSGGVNLNLQTFDYASEVLQAQNSLDVECVAGVRSPLYAFLRVAASVAPFALKKVRITTNVISSDGELNSLANNQNGVGGSWYNTIQGQFYSGALAGLRETSRYTYATNTSDRLTVLQVGRGFCAAAGNKDFSVVAGGVTAGTTGISSTERHVLSESTWRTGTALAVNRAAMNNGASNLSVCLFAGGYGTVASAAAALSTTDRYTIATDARVAGAALGLATGSMGVASGAAYGLLAGGLSAYITGTQRTAINKYNFAGNSFAVSATSIAASANLNRWAV